MKHAKRFLALLLALVMVMGLAVSVSAETTDGGNQDDTTTTVDITINDGTVRNAKYAAYKLLKATNAAPEISEDNKPVESGKFGYTMNENQPKYREIMLDVLISMQKISVSETNPIKNVTDTDIINAIRNLSDATENEPTEIQTFANQVYSRIKADTTITADVITENNKFSNIPQGYYLIVETHTGIIDSDNDNKPDSNMGSDVYSLVMLDTQGKVNITVTTKEGLPTVKKEVEEKNDSTGATPTWGESADHDIGDDVKFRITGTVSDKYASYKSYDYMFVDSMEPGLTFNENSLVITIDGINVTDYFTKEYVTHTHTEACEDNNNPCKAETGFTVWANLKELDKLESTEELKKLNITADSSIVVTYTAKLNKLATRGAKWNENEVVLYYENDPYYVTDSTSDETPPPHTPGETPKDTAIVFTFEGVVNKVDNNQNALAGAGFTLYKWYATSGTAGEWKMVGTKIEPAADKTTFEWIGLDAGKYKLVESSAPAGYNKAEDLEFEVVAQYTTTEPIKLSMLSIKDANGQSISTGTTPTFTLEMEQGEYTGVFATNVVNLTGTELPSTGGMGTTILYIAGGILVLAAIVLLVTKKRMASAE